MALDNDNSFDQATDVPMLFSDSGTVGGPRLSDTEILEDPIDLYKFVAPRSGRVEVSLTNITGDVAINFYDEDGVRIGRNSALETTASELTIIVGEGRTYFIGIESTYGFQETEFKQASYDIETGFLPHTSGTDNNNSFNAAIIWSDILRTDGSHYLSTVSPSATYNGLGPEDTSDFYTFTAESNQILTLTLTGEARNFDLKIYDGDRNLVTHIDDNDAYSESFSLDVREGQQYYFEILSVNGTQSLYIFGGSFGNGNEYFETATAINFLDRTSGSIRESDPVDHLVFVPSESGIATIIMSGLRDDYDLSAYDEDENLISESRLPGELRESVSFGVAAGRSYFLKIEYGSDRPVPEINGFYYVQGTLEPQLPDGNEARVDAASLDIDLPIVSEIGGSDENDYYTFIAPEHGRADITLNEFSSDIDLRIYDADGELIAASASDSDEERLSISVDEGATYFIRVNTARAGLTDYQLGMSFSPRSFDESIDVVGNASTDRSLLLGETVTSEIEQSRDSDWYEITVPENSVYVVRVETADGSTLANPDMVLRSTNGNFIAQDTDDDGEAAEFILSEPGTYYLDVRSYSGDTGAYTLTAQSQFVQNERPGNSTDILGSVESDAVLMFGETISGRLDSSTDSDWFQVEVADADSVRVVLAGSESNAGTLSEGSLVIRTEDGGFVEQVSARAGQNSELTITEPGVYWIDVRSHNNLSGSYQLTATSANNGGLDGDGPASPTGPDIAGDTTTHAQLFPGSSRTETLESTSDSDWFKIVNLPGETLTVTISGLGANTLNDPDLVLRGSTGDFVNQDIGRPGEDVVFELSAAGTFYLDVRSYSGSTGSYSISVDDNASPASSLALVQIDALAAS